MPSKQKSNASNSHFDPAPYSQALLDIKAVERRILREIREEAERQDRRREEDTEGLKHSRHRI